MRVSPWVRDNESLVSVVGVYRGLDENLDLDSRKISALPLSARTRTGCLSPAPATKPSPAAQSSHKIVFH